MLSQDGRRNPHTFPKCINLSDLCCQILKHQHFYKVTVKTFLCLPCVCVCWNFVTVAEKKDFKVRLWQHKSAIERSRLLPRQHFGRAQTFICLARLLWVRELPGEHVDLEGGKQVCFADESMCSSWGDAAICCPCPQGGSKARARGLPPPQRDGAWLIN